MARAEVVSVPALSLESLDRLQAEDLVLWIAADERPLKGGAGYVDWRANGWLSRLVANGAFKAQRGERVLTMSQGRIQAKRVFLVGLGESKGFNARSADEVAEEAAVMLGEAGATDIAVAVPGTGDGDAHRQLLESLLARVQKNKSTAKMTTWGPWRKM